MEDATKDQSLAPGDLLKTHEVADIIGVSTHTLIRWRRAGEGPPTLRLAPRTHRYWRPDVLAWIQNHRPTGNGS